MAERQLTVDDIMAELELKRAKDQQRVPKQQDMSRIDEIVREILTQKKERELKQENRPMTSREKAELEKEIRVQTKTLTRQLAKQRTPEGTTARMAKKLRKLGGRGAQVWRDVTVVSQRGRCVCPMLYAAREGVYVVQVYHFGLDVSGSASSKYWTLSFNKDVRQVDNPLDAMDEQIVVVNRVLAKAGLGHVPVEKLVLFADVYGRPRVDLRGVDCAVVRQDLNKWRKQKKNLPSVSLAELAKALEASFQR